MKSDSSTVSKTIKDGLKAGTHKCIFSYTKQEWPAGVEKAKAKKSVKKGQVLFEDDYNILTRQEDPELFCKWVFFLEERFLKDPNNYSKVEWETFDHILMEIVAGESKEVVKATLAQLHPQKVHYTLGTYNLFTNGYVKKELSTVYDTDTKLKVLLHKDNIHDLKINAYNECKYRLANLIFGTDMTGSNSYYVQLRLTMKKFRTDPNQGIMNYHRRVIQFQTYLPETSWEAGALEGSPKVGLTDLELRQNLAGAISVDQMAKLVKNEHNVWTQPYTKTINKLDNYERALKLAREEKANLAKIIAQNDKNNGKQKSNSKRLRESSNNSTDKGEKPKCKTCGKHHHGVCRFKNSSATKPWQKGGNI